MRKKRRSNHAYQFDRRLLFGVIGVIVLLVASLNVNPEVNFDQQSLPDVQDETLPVAESPDSDEEAVKPEKEEPLAADNADSTNVLSEQLWADVGEGITTPNATNSSTERISLNVKDANLLDVLSMIAYKIGINVIFLEEPTQITLKTDTLSPNTTFQIVLQKAGLDYLTIGDNYIVGNRDRLYGDFTNRMFLSRFDLFYVSASDMEGYINELGMPVESLSVDSNQKALWMQGTPMTLGKAREIINTLDVIDNASFAEGGGRKIRMPVATATGERAEEELEALIDLLSILLDGFRDDRTDMGWVTWDHPDPVPSIYMDWESPVIKPYDIKMKITRDFNRDYTNQTRFLIAEGTPDNINLVNQMIPVIAGTPRSPLNLSIQGENTDPDIAPTRVNINAASHDELQKIINIGPERASEIIALRPFNSLDELTRVSGIAEARLLEIKQEGIAYVGPAGGAGINSVEWIPDTQQPVSKRSYTLSLNGVPDEGGSLSGYGSYTEGTYVTVKATPAEGYQFVRWIENGSELSTSKTYSFTIYGDRSLEAVYTSISEEDNDESGEENLANENDENMESAE